MIDKRSIEEAMAANGVVYGPDGERITAGPVTPEQAKALLELNTENYRRLRPGLVDKYARDMMAGQWRFTTDTIKVDRNGVMSDGQNRLSAQVKSNTTLWWVIGWDVDPEATMVMDGGAARTAADHLAHIGTSNAHQVAAIARMIIRRQSGRGNTGVSTSEVHALVESDPSLVKIASMVAGLHKNTLKLATKATLGYLWWRLANVDPFKAEEFMRRLDRLDNLDKGSPILALHRRLLALKTERGTYASVSVQNEVIAMAIYAWNAWVKGETREMLKTLTKADGTLYMPEPIAPRPEPDPPAIVEQNQLPEHRRRNGAA